MMPGRGQRVALALVVVAMLVLQFWLRPRIWDARFAPDFLLIAVLMVATVVRPGAAALLGLALGLVADAFTPAQLGAGMLAHSVVAYAAAWSRVVFFAENYLVHFGTFLVGCWLRNMLVVLLSGLGAGALLNEALIGGPLQGLATALVGTALLFGMREWLGIRLEA